MIHGMHSNQATLCATAYEMSAMLTVWIAKYSLQFHYLVFNTIVNKQTLWCNQKHTLLQTFWFIWGKIGPIFKLLLLFSIFLSWRTQVNTTKQYVKFCKHILRLTHLKTCMCFGKCLRCSPDWHAPLFSVNRSYCGLSSMLLKVQWLENFWTEQQRAKNHSIQTCKIHC